MRILDVLTSPWAIEPTKLSEIKSIYQSHFRGEKIDWKAMQAQFGMMLSDEGSDGYQVMDGVAVIPVKGVLSKGMSLMAWLFGGSSMKQIGMDFQAALIDPAVKAILLDVDSPGGTVDGTEELANQIYAARGVKPINAYSDGDMASGAYWIASAAEKIFISGDTVMVGSIGVVATHIDQSKWEEQIGAKFTEITAGRYKRLVSAHKPLSEEGKTYIQDQVDYLYSAFVDTVGRNRGIDQKAALEMADGKTFIGKQAVEIGLVDGVSTFDDLIIAGSELGNKNYYAKEDEIVNLEDLKTKHPDVYAEAVAASKAAGLTEGEAIGKAAGLIEGAAAERQRITDVRTQLIPGHEALIEGLMNDGKTTGPEAAVKVLAAEKAVRASNLEKFNADGKQTVANASAQDFTASSDGETAANQAEAGDKLDVFAKAIKAEKKCTYSEALAQAKAAHPALAKVYEGKEE